MLDSHLCRVGLGAAALMLLPGAPAWPQLADPGTWQFQCMTEGAAADPPLCTTELWLSQDQREFVLYFAHDQGGKVPLVIAGDDDRYVAARIQVDDNQPLETRSCNAGGCYFVPPLSLELLKQFQHGRGARVVVEAAGDTVPLDQAIPLAGFSTAYAQFGAGE